MTTMQNARPAANGTGGEQVRQTSDSVADLPELPHPRTPTEQADGPALRMPAGWHKQAEHEGRWWYAEGYADGYAAAEQNIANEITEALGYQPMDRKRVIRWLAAGIGVVRKGVPR